MRIGILSDTHGTLRPEVLERLHGCDHLLHAGDVGELSLLEPLRTVAPVTAVRGNMDAGTSAATLPDRIALELGGFPIRMVHRREEIDPAWPREARLIVYGHTHRPELEWRGDCLLLNPGQGVA
jgi:putative phosphoesterase